MPKPHPFRKKRSSTLPASIRAMDVPAQSRAIAAGPSRTVPSVFAKSLPVPIGTTPSRQLEPFRQNRIGDPRARSVPSNHHDGFDPVGHRLVCEARFIAALLSVRDLDDSHCRECASDSRQCSPRPSSAGSGIHDQTDLQWRRVSHRRFRAKMRYAKDALQGAKSSCAPRCPPTL